MLAAQGDWLPVRAALHPEGLFLALRGIPPEELRDAFMQETVARVSAAERIVQVERAGLGVAAPGDAPAGLIFHVARCGSTLVAQMLKQSGVPVVYAEPLPFNELLLPPHAWPRHELVAALRSLGSAFGRHAGGPYMLKFSSWNTLFCDLIAEAFPASPWILCLRDPVEVGVSLQRQPAGWLQGRDEAGQRLQRVVDPGRQSASPEETIARFYGAFCDAASRLDTGRGRLIDYGSLPAAVWHVVAPHFSLTIDAAQRQRLADTACLQAKAPLGKAVEYTDDSATKQAAATAALRHMIDVHARPNLERLYDRFTTERAAP